MSPLRQQGTNKYKPWSSGRSWRDTKMYTETNLLLLTEHVGWDVSGEQQLYSLT